MSARRGWVAMVIAAALGGACASRPSLPAPISVPAPAVPVVRASLASVALAPLVDNRPAALRRSARPSQDERFSILLMGQGFAFVNGTRFEGPSFVAADRMRIGGDAALPALGRWVASALQQASAGPVSTIPAPAAASPAAADLARALGKPEGVVVLPILDQLDAGGLSSSNEMRGGSSTSEQRGSTEITTTTSGAASLADETPLFANVRMRLLIVQVAGGQPAGSHVVYLRGAGGSVDEALAMAGRELTAGLDELFAPPAPPAPPAPTTTDPAPAAAPGSAATSADTTSAPQEAP